MTQNTLTKADLMQFTGSEHWYRHTLVPSIVYTDGARHVAKFGGAYWLLDEIALPQSLPALKAEPFQLWTLTVHGDHKATLTCTDGNEATIYTKPIPWTDFPLDEIRFYFIDNTILLPSEY